MASESGDSTSILTFAARGLKGTWIRSLGSDEEKVLPAAKKLIFSNDGLYLAICDEKKGVSILSTSNYQETLWEVPRPKTAEMIFSPSGKFIALWELAKVQNNQEIANNFHIYDWKENKLVLETLQKKQLNWCPQWSEDEFVCSRYNNGEIVFYEDHDFTKFKYRLSLANISSYSLACSKAPYHVSVSVAGSGKGDPSFVRLFRYPKFSQADALANKSFFKASKTELFWNPAGTALVFLTVAEEKTSESYFGEQELHFISTKQESCIVPRAKRGPVYSVTWNPNSKEFCVVYGFMPSKVTLYNLKCDPIFDFGTGPRNLAFYNPFGSILCLAGFGALNGNMEFWDLEKQKLLTSFLAVNTTHFEWCPDGIHFVTATLSPRLRVENGYKLWHYSGKTIKSWQTDVLLEVLWAPLPKGTLSAPEVKAVKAEEAPKQVKPQAYVPPMRRNAAGQNTPASTSQTKYREAYEPPSNLRQDENKELSKSALKNKKKREQKKAKKLENAQNPSNAETTTNS